MVSLHKDNKKSFKIAYALLIFTGAVGVHRYYVNERVKTILYLLSFLVLAIITSGLSIPLMMVYEGAMLPRKVLLANGDLDELPKDKRLIRILDMYKGNTYKKKLHDLEQRLERDGVTELWEIEDKKAKVESDYERVLIEMGNKEKEIGDVLSRLEGLKVEEDRHKELERLDNKVISLKGSIDKYESKLKELRLENGGYQEIEGLKNKINKLKKETVYWSEIVESESLGVFTRPDELYPSSYYKEELKRNNSKQKEMKKANTATNATDWTIGGSVSEGKKFTKANIKQILRSFDNESTVLVKTLTNKNYQSKLKALGKTFEQLNKLNVSAGVSITKEYLELKEEELGLAYKGIIKTEEEKEVLREEREREKEEKRVLKEINDKKKLVDKDIKHYDNVTKELRLKQESIEDIDKINEIEAEIEALVEQKESKEKEKEELDYRELHAKAGYVYIISNIGAFGKDVVKIGVTRRLNPEERVRELSGASVPFKFDIHALIFSHDAFQLEAELHRVFNGKRVNLVNNKKEFFNVSIEEVSKELEKYKNLAFNFEEEPEALEYKETLNIKKKDREDEVA